MNEPAGFLRESAADKQCEEPQLQDDGFSFVYRRFAAGIHGYLHRLCGSHHVAEELTQETFIAAFRNARNFRGASSIKTWLYAIATNKFHDHFRKERGGQPQQKDIQIDFPCHLPCPATVLEREEVVRKVREAVAVLPEQLRAALMLVRFEGMKYREAAAVLGVTEDAVRMQVHRAHLALAGMLKGVE